MQQYLALIRKDDGTSYGVEFPDLPGLASGGETMEEALRNAGEALAVHLDGLAEDGAEIPEPSALDVIMRDLENRGAVAVLVNAPLQKGKAVRINVTFDENLLARIDQMSAAAGIGRSGWLAGLARKELEGPMIMTGDRLSNQATLRKALKTTKQTMPRRQHRALKKAVDKAHSA